MILDRKFYGSQASDLFVFDTSAPLYTLHPHRKMLQLLQQHIRLSPTVQPSGSAMLKLNPLLTGTKWRDWMPTISRLFHMLFTHSTMIHRPSSKAAIGQLQSRGSTCGGRHSN